jgi:hypothetical protein
VIDQNFEQTTAYRRKCGTSTDAQSEQRKAIVAETHECSSSDNNIID